MFSRICETSSGEYLPIAPESPREADARLSVALVMSPGRSGVMLFLVFSYL